MCLDSLSHTVADMSEVLTDAIRSAAANLDQLNEIMEATHDLMEECVTALEDLSDPFEEVKEALAAVDEACETIVEKGEAVFEDVHDAFDNAEQVADELFGNINEAKTTLRNELRRLVDESVKRPLIECRAKFLQEIDDVVENMKAFMTEEVRERFVTTLQQDLSNLLDSVKEEFSEGIENLRSELIGTADASGSQRELSAQVREVLTNAIKPLLNEMNRFMSLAGSVGVSIG